ncbi:hypothetical protein Q5692_35730 [Microcoleus sp. C2C3]|uniref:hypothetical protein n=1 Tax=unclassified Microcoleus TaxID=2642155 RepID=UPI002FD2B715
MTLDKQKLEQQLTARLNQLHALINMLENQGTKHPQYHQLSMLKEQKNSVDSQLTRLQKLM